LDVSCGNLSMDVAPKKQCKKPLTVEP